MMYFLALRTGSSGNCIYIASETTKILIDIGLSYKVITQELKKIGVEFSQIDAILITHAHSDHIGTLPIIWSKHKDIPIYASEQTFEHSKRMSSDNRWDKIRKEGYYLEYPKTLIGDLSISSSPSVHDIEGAVIYSVSDGVDKVSVTTDTGDITSEMFDKIKNSSLFFIESNYSEYMLDKSNRSEMLKERIRNCHLENIQTLNQLYYLIGDKTKAVVLGHISEECNDPKTVQKNVQEIREELEPFQSIKWFLSPRKETSAFIRLDKDEIQILNEGRGQL
ncbi:MAG: MBL fold metallo-hydrolase [Candidatus Heimdallarchaeota archaeon]|nr:MBL fold metallo-hydrolase [Candidatus Heimdallarchaeota archaeon]MCK5047905.1 MBL fold metallo-hydrolase [Candidatus Heimdallarchaeota archaeon]